MHVIKADNVRDALPKSVQYLLSAGNDEQTREGYAIVAPGPVAIHYKYPKQHVLINPVRDANPFFHLMEAMWMLAGRQDGAFLDNYVKDFSKRFAKDGIVMDSYGQRWRHGYRYDQLGEIVNQLRKDPTTRQAVLQMWGAGRDDLRAFSSKPCNLAAVFRIQNGHLNMAVYNRSNDVIWGACGANAVHFPILQEYLANKIEVEIGEYWQITNNLHLYGSHYDMLCDRTKPPLIEGDDLHVFLEDNGVEYEPTFPLMSNEHEFDTQLHEVLNMIEDINKGEEIYAGNISNQFLLNVVLPMAQAHQFFKQKKWEEAFLSIHNVKAEDWKAAGIEWLERRYAK